MRSAWKPRSCSPIGPAPTREPRIALPPDAMLLLAVLAVLLQWRLRAGIELGDEPGHDDPDDPHQPENHRDAVEVAFGYTRRTQVGGHTAAEHVGQAAATSFVEQDEQRQQEACDAQEHLQ